MDDMSPKLLLVSLLYFRNIAYGYMVNVDSVLDE